MRTIEISSTEFQTNWKTLYQQAAQSRQHAHAPFSKFFVGAAVQDKDGNIFEGNNVENMSYGLTICAERTAIASMVAQVGKKKIERICVVLLGGDKKGGSPCGACRQVIWEFCQGDWNIEVLTCDPEMKNPPRLFTIGELLPDGFVFTGPK